MLAFRHTNAGVAAMLSLDDALATVPEGIKSFPSSHGELKAVVVVLFESHGGSLFQALMDPSRI